MVVRLAIFMNSNSKILRMDWTDELNWTDVTASKPPHITEPIYLKMVRKVHKLKGLQFSKAKKVLNSWNWSSINGYTERSQI